MDPSFLDLSASASPGQETEDEEDHLEDELDDFIVDSVSTKCVFLTFFVRSMMASVQRL